MRNLLSAMSRIGKKPIEIPQGVEVRIEGRRVLVKGPKGELAREFRPEVAIEQKDGSILVNSLSNSKLGKSLWGLSRTLLANMIQGVFQGYAKRLEIEGVGYKAAMEGNSLTLNVGFSNPVKMELPPHTTVVVEKNIITVSGIDKEEVGQFAASIRKVRVPEPYKGKGIRYEGEVIRRKLGKKAATAAGSKA